MTTLREIWSVFKVQLCISIVLSVIAASVAFMFFDTDPPYNYDASRSYIEPDHADGGDTVTSNWKVTMNRWCPGTMQRQLFDPRTGAIVSTYDTIPMAHHSIIDKDGYLRRNFILPRAISKGRTGYRVNVCFSCNPLQRLYPVCYKTPDLFFMVD